MISQKLIIVTGLPCVGKSTLAESIAKNLSIPLFSVDPIESSIIKSGIKKSFETGLSAYLVAETLASEHLKLGQSVLIDSVSAVKEARIMWKNLAQNHNVELVIIECILDSKIHRKRIESRVRNMHGMPEVTWEYVEECKKEYLPWDEEHLVINTADDHEQNIRKTLEYISKRQNKKYL